MIFTGDFAQLPPVCGEGGGGPSLWNGKVASYSKAGTLYAQEAAIGKALWHQVTTCVILRQNMRMQNTSAEDVKL